MNRRGVRRALYIGNRRVLAMTCWGPCARLLPGEAFAWRRCRNGYFISRRCQLCRWHGASRNPGRQRGRFT